MSYRIAKVGFGMVLLAVASPLIAQNDGKPGSRGPAQKTASTPLANILNLSKCGLTYTRASAKLAGRSSLPPSVTQPASLTITGIPANATIERAFLWWVLERTTTGPVSVTLKAPGGNQSTFAGTLIGSDAYGKCWSGGGGSSGWRADVTTLVTAPFNGVYQVSGLPATAAISIDTDGVTLFIAYSVAGTGAKGTLVVNDGLLVSNTGASLTQALSGFSTCQDASARSFVQVADFQNFGGSGIHWNNGPLTPFVEEFWDWEQQTTGVPASLTSMTTKIDCPNDCIAWQVLGLSYRCPATECSPCQNVTINARKQYVAKFVCYRANDQPPQPLQVVRGFYGTTINVHNPAHCPELPHLAPDERRAIDGETALKCPPVRFAKKVAIAHPGQKPGTISGYRYALLKVDQAFQIDCDDIRRIAGVPPSFLDGFVVIESEGPLDVTAVYTARPFSGDVSTLDVENVRERDIQATLNFCN